MNIIRWKRQARTTLRTGFWQALLVCMAALFLGDTATSVAGLTPYTLHGILQFFVTDGGAVQVLILLAIFQLLAGGAIAVGRARYFLQAAQGGGCVKDMLYAFALSPRHYIKIALAQFITLSIVAVTFAVPLVIIALIGGSWNVPTTIVVTLLLMLPGLTVLYRFRLLPYILASKPDLTLGKAISTSNLWSARTRFEMFKLDVAFVGLYILAPLTFGIGLFFVIPYHHATMAQFFTELDEMMTMHPDGSPYFNRLADIMDVEELNKLKA